MNIAVACAGTKTIGTDRLGPSVHFFDLQRLQVRSGQVNGKVTL
jgi:hypothetical protein